MKVLLVTIVMLLTVQALVLLTILSRIDNARIRMVIICRGCRAAESPEAEPTDEADWWKNGGEPPG